ncbi:MAG TPA: hypothetical protein VGG46_01175 [Terriglobales bacterium]|jgi:hypothetical protein
MTQFTQLNLNGKSETKSAGEATKAESQRPASMAKSAGKSAHKPKTMTIVGSAVALSLMGVALLETSGCSKAAKTTITAPTMQASNQPEIPAPPVVPSKPVVKKPVKKAARAKIPVATYRNADYGISFRYPKYDRLKQGDEAKVEWMGLGPVPMNFSQPGGLTLSAVELPNGLYPGTDFNSAFFNANVDPKLTAEQCEQFASPDVSTAADKSSSPSKVKIGKTEFSEMETLAGDTKQADAKYYHVFQNGTCYEFTLGMQTARADGDEEPAPVNRNQVFHKLEWILATVKLDAPAVPEASATVAATTAAMTSTTPTVAPTAATASHPVPVKVIDDRQ